MNSASFCQNNFVDIKFANCITNLLTKKMTSTSEQKLSELIKQKYNKNERFYGIEISASSSTTNQLNYGLFKAIPPLFTTIVWIDRFADIEPITKIPQFEYIEKIKPYTIVAPNLSCYKLTKDKLKNYLDLWNVSNIFAIRGEIVNNHQEFKHGSDLVKEIRELYKDKISIGVAGHPEIHQECKTFDEDLRNLKRKVDQGADFIITQLCFNSGTIIDFIRKCRQIGINIPIIPLIFAPSNYRNLQLILEITKVSISKDLLTEYEQFKDDQIKFQELSVQKAIEFINSLYNSDVNILGIHFLTFNHFDTIQKITNEIY